MLSRSKPSSLIMPIVVTLTAFVYLVSPGRAVTSKYLDNRNAKLVDPTVIVSMFKGNTWLWDDGAGYFRQDGKFYAWAGKGNDISYGIGTWEVYRWGNLCFYSTWHARSGSRSVKKCFEHRISDGTIFQTETKKSKWYIFKHKEPLPTDEYVKIIVGDEVTAKLEIAKTELERLLDGRKNGNQ